MKSQERFSCGFVDGDPIWWCHDGRHVWLEDDGGNLLDADKDSADKATLRARITAMCQGQDVDYDGDTGHYQAGEPLE